MQPSKQTEANQGKAAPQGNTKDQLLQEAREIFRDAPDYVKSAVEALRDELGAEPETRMESAGRIGNRQGVVSELTMIAPIAKGAADRIRRLLKLLRGNFQGADKVGSVHDMRFVFLDNDTKLLFCTAYDGDWDDYIDDFATKIPNQMDALFSALEGWPGIRSPAVKDWILKYQVPADAWYVASPHLSVAQTKRLEKVDKALNEFLDKLS